MKLSSRYVTFFSRSSKGQLQMWSCWIEDDGITVTSRWGLKDGKQQTTQDKMSSRGKKGTRAYKSPQQVAIEEHTRQVEKKMRAGYVEAEKQAHAVQLDKLKVELDFDRLPRGFAPAKPIREIDIFEALELDKAGLLAVQRKRDGMRHYIVAGSEGIRVYSRGMDDLSAHFERLTQELDLPVGTILDSEFVVTSPEGDDDFTAVSEICRSKADRAKRTMVTYERNGYTLQFVVFDILFYDRLPTWQLPYRDRYNALIDALEKAHRQTRTTFEHVVIMPRLTKSLTQCIARMRKRKWEGLVLWRADQSTQVHMNRSPKRCNCYKFKPMKEGDFIATGYERGTGRNSKVMGALKLSVYRNPSDEPTGTDMLMRRASPMLRRWNPDASSLVSVGKVGTGFDDATRVAALKWTYPCVVEVKYEKLTKAGLRFPSFLRKRDDKKLRECVL